MFRSDILPFAEAVWRQVWRRTARALRRCPGADIRFQEGFGLLANLLTSLDYCESVPRSRSGEDLGYIQALRNVGGQ